MVRVLLTTMRGLDGKGGVERLMKSFYDSREKFDDVTFSTLATAAADAPKAILVTKWIAVYVHFVWLCMFNRFDVAHINIAWRGSTLRKIAYLHTARLFGKKTVLHLHGSGYDNYYASSSQRLQAAIRATFGRADRVVVLSQYWRRFVVDTLGIPPENVVEIANGVAPFVRTRAPAARMPGETATILFLGEVGPRKGVSTLIEAAARPELAGLRWRMIVAGNGDLDFYRAEAAGLGVSDRVTFPGWQDEAGVARLLEEAHLLVLPSQAENQPISILNAMSAGLPVVASNVGAIPEMVEDGASGLLCPPRQPEALAHAIAALVADPALCERMGRRGKEIFAAHFQLDETIRQFRELYLSLGRDRTGGKPSSAS